MSNLITGGAGFIGSHLIDSLINSGESVLCIDNLSTGDKKNISKWEKSPNSTKFDTFFKIFKSEIKCFFENS